MSQVLGAFGLLVFAMLRPVLAWSEFWNLWNFYFFNLFSVIRGKPRILNQWVRGHGCSTCYRIPVPLACISRIYELYKPKITSFHTVRHLLHWCRRDINLCPWLWCITGQISKSVTRTPPREYYVWWSQEMLCVYRLDKKKDNRVYSLRFIVTFNLIFVS
jgi:hypothetical protein